MKQLGWVQRCFIPNEGAQNLITWPSQLAGSTIDHFFSWRFFVLVKALYLLGFKHCKRNFLRWFWHLNLLFTWFYMPIEGISQPAMFDRGYVLFSRPLFRPSGPSMSPSWAASALGKVANRSDSPTSVSTVRGAEKPKQQSLGQSIAPSPEIWRIHHIHPITSQQIQQIQQYSNV